MWSLYLCQVHCLLNSDAKSLASFKSFCESFWKYVLFILVYFYLFDYLTFSYFIVFISLCPCHWPFYQFINLRPLRCIILTILLVLDKFILTLCSISAAITSLSTSGCWSMSWILQGSETKDIPLNPWNFGECEGCSISLTPFSNSTQASSSH